MVDEHQEWEVDPASKEPLDVEPGSSGSRLTWLWVLAVVVVLVGAGWWFLFDQNTRHAAKQATIERTPVPSPAPNVAPVEPEFKETEGPEWTPEQKTFLTYFTRSVLTQALLEQAGTWDLRAFKKLVHTAKGSEFLVDAPGMTWDRWEKERSGIIRQARQALADPDFLRVVWKQFREPVLAAVRASGKAASVRTWCVRAMPYFSGALPRAKSRVLAAYYQIDRELDREMKKSPYDEDKIRTLTQALDRQYQVVTKAGLDADDIYLFEFSRRRMNEGGRELLQVYAAILEDLNQSAE